MLPPYIIEQLRQREEARKEAENRVQLELPTPPRAPRAPDAEESNRGVVIIQVG